MSIEQDAYTNLAARHNLGESKRYRQILQMLMTPAQAQLVVQLPATPDELSQKTKTPLAQVNKDLEELFLRGVIIPRNFQTREGYRFCRSTEQLHDATQTMTRFDKATEAKYFALWDEFCNKEWYPEVAKTYATREIPLERIVPAYKAIEKVPGIQPYDDVRELIRLADPISVVPCPCRRHAQQCNKPMDVCLQLGRGGEYAIMRGSGKKISYTEAIKVMDEVEDGGEVHIWPNVATGAPRFMCNCCDDCCIAWVPLKQNNIPHEKRAAKSRFEAINDQSKCDGCQVCVDRCMFDAIEIVKVPGSKKMKAQVDPEKCWGCGLCVIKCEPNALSMKLVRPPQHIPGAVPA